MPKNAWLKLTPWREGRPILVLAEGVLLYFTPTEGERFLRRLSEAARARSASLDLVADFATPFMVRHSRRRPSVSQTGARFASAEHVPVIAPGLRLIEEADINRQAGGLAWAINTLSRVFTGKPIYFAAHYRLPAGG